jgi:hypothetical protein
MSACPFLKKMSGGVLPFGFFPINRNTIADQADLFTTLNRKNGNNKHAKCA